MKQPDRNDLVELIELRSVLECNAAARAARRIGDAELDELDGCWAAMRAAADELLGTGKEKILTPLARWGLADMAFHMVLLRAAGNSRVMKVIEDTHVMTQMFGYRSDYPEAWADMESFVTGNCKVHHDVYIAVRGHDVEAARQAMAAHMDRARKNMLARFDWLQGQRDAASPLVEDFPNSVRQLISEMQMSNFT